MASLVRLPESSPQQYAASAWIHAYVQRWAPKFSTFSMVSREAMVYPLFASLVHFVLYSCSALDQRVMRGIQGVAGG